MYKVTATFTMTTEEIYTFEIDKFKNPLTEEQKDCILKKIYNCGYTVFHENRKTISLNVKHIVSIELLQSEVQEE